MQNDKRGALHACKVIKMKAIFSAATLALTGLVLAPSVDAAQVTSTFQVKLVVQASCSFSTGGIQDIDLGSRATNANNVEATTNVRVQCTKGATPVIKMVSTDWKLKDGAGEGPQYRLYGSDNQQWDNNNGRSFTSGGGEQVFEVKAKVDNVGDKAGTFKDTVTVQVDF